MEDINALVKAYINIRTERDKITEEYEAHKAVLDGDLDQLKIALLQACNSVGANSIRTDSGLVMKVLKERAYTVDWDGFKKFIVEHNVPELLEKRIHQGNFKEYIQDHKDKGLPPGINIQREWEISVRKPTSRSVVDE